MSTRQSEQKPRLLVRIYRYLTANTIRRRLMVTLTLVVMLSTIISGISSTIIFFQTGQQEVLDQVQAAASQHEQEINNWVRDLETELALLFTQQDTLRQMRAVLQNTTFRDIIERELAANFQEVIDLTHHFDELFILDLEGNVVVSTDPTHKGEDHSQETYFLQGVYGPQVHPLRADRETGAIEVFATRPILLENGQVVGVLVGRTSLEPLYTSLQVSTGLGTTGEIFLVDTNKILLTPSRYPGYVPGKTFINTEGSRLAFKESGTGTYINHRDREVVGAYRYIPSLEVGLLAEQESSEALRPVYASLYTNLGITIVAVLSSILLGYFVTQRIISPMQELAVTARQIAQGNLTITARVPSLQEAAVLAESFNQMTERLRHLIATLEERIYERTRALETSIGISSQLITIRDQNQLLRFVVEEIQKEFNFYHTHIYLLEKTTNELVMAEGSGEVAKELKARNHRLKVGQGIVGTVAARNESVLSNNVFKDPHFVRNPLLPHTKSELAVPLRKGQELLGVLDLQSDEFDRFRYADMSLMQAIANQTAIALDNIRLLSEMENALREVEHLNRRLTGEVWEDFLEEISARGIYYSHGRQEPLQGDRLVLLPPMKDAVKKQKVVVQTRPGNGAPPQAELGIPLVVRGQVIGALGLKRENAPEWLPDEIDVLQAIATQLAQALDNARLTLEQEKTIVQLKDIDRLKSEFLTSMSHELRTPLNSILGFADVLLQGIDGELPPMALQDIQLIYNSGQHLLALINDILDLSKIEAGQMELVIEPIDVAEVVDEVRTAANSLIKKKPVDLLTDLPPDLPLVNADKLRLKQILLNLVSNAAKFTEEGSITISAGIDEQEPDKVRIAVTDTGIGIPPDKIDAIFDRFRQADSSTTRKYGGTGLGLAICKQLVEMHGGTIGVESEEGVGSTFFFTIPAAQNTELDDQE